MLACCVQLRNVSRTVSELIAPDPAEQLMRIATYEESFLALLAGRGLTPLGTAAVTNRTSSDKFTAPSGIEKRSEQACRQLHGHVVSSTVAPWALALP